MKHRSEPPPPLGVLHESICFTVHGYIPVDRFDPGNDVDKGGVGA
jgi:hypothetical protein